MSHGVSRSRPLGFKDISMWLVEGPNENRRVTVQRAYRTQEAFTIAATKLEEKFGEYVAANEHLLHDTNSCQKIEDVIAVLEDLRDFLVKKATERFPGFRCSGTPRSELNPIRCRAFVAAALQCKALSHPGRGRR
jgi:hypothetical protein